MKTITRIITFFIFLVMCCEAFAAPSGMKDVGTNNADNVITISAGPYADDKIPYSISFASHTDTTKYYTVYATYGKTEYTPVEVILSQGENILLEDQVENPPNGTNALNIKVIRSDGEIVATYNGEFEVLMPAKVNYLEGFTRRVGFAGSYSGAAVERHSEYAKIGSGRLDFGWSGSESQKGVYKIGRKEDVEILQKNGIDIVAMMGYNNTLYEPRGVRFGPDDKENVDAYANFANAIREKYPNIEYYEIWNEPNGASFWAQGRNESDYTYLAEVTHSRLKREDKNVKTLSGGVAIGDSGYVRKTLAEGLYPNIDIIANHPYMTPGKVDAAYHGLLRDMTDLITSYGGWKEQYITEVGWPTHKGGNSEEDAAIQLVKEVIVADYYDINQNQYYMIGDTIYDGNYSTSNSEHNFGVIYKSATGKPNQGTKYKKSWYAVKTMLDETNGAVYAGMLPFEDKDIQASLYLRDGEVICVIWTKGYETTVTFEDEILSAVDMNGNHISGTDTFKIGEKPIYIHGLNKNILLKKLPQKIENLINDRMATAFDESKEKKGFKKAKEILLSDVDMANEILAKGSYPTEEEALSYLERHYSLADEILEMYKSGELDITEAQLNGLLYVNYWTGNIWTSIYMMAVDEDTDLNSYKILSTDAIGNAEAKIKEKASENTLCYSEAILQYAKNFNEKAVGVSKLSGDNQFKAGALKGWDMLSKNIAELAVKMTEAETVRHNNILLHLLSSECEVKLSTNDVIYPSLYNYRDSQALTGYVELVSPDGEVVGKSEAVTVAAGENTAVEVKTLLPEIEKGTYKIRFIENGEAIVERNAHIKGTPVYNVILEPVMKTFDELDTLKVTVENLKEDKLDGSIELEPLCNWSLDTPVKEFSIGATEAKTLEWQIENKESEAYHFYPFKIMIKDAEGHILYEKKQMLGFSIVNKTNIEFSPESFTGDITGWENAYPMYASYPENPENPEEWKNHDFLARGMVMWDQNYFYIVYDVVDQYHANLQTQASLWNGDGVQFAFDTLNNAEKQGYDGDDYEFGVSYNDAEGNIAYSWKSNGKDSVDIPDILILQKLIRHFINSLVL